MPRGESGEGALRSRAPRHVRSRPHHRSHSARAATRGAAPRAPGSTDPAASDPASGSASRGRPGTRSPGSRPTSARTASRLHPEAPPRPWPASAPRAARTVDGPWSPSECRRQDGRSLRQPYAARPGSDQSEPGQIIDSTGDDDGRLCVRRDVFRDTPLEHAAHQVQAAGPNDNGIEPAVLGHPLDRDRRISGRLDELGLNPLLAQHPPRLDQLLGVHARVVPGLDGKASRANRDDTHDGDGRAREAGQFGGGIQRALGGLTAIVGNKDLLHDGCSFHQRRANRGRLAHRQVPSPRARCHRPSGLVGGAESPDRPRTMCGMSEDQPARYDRIADGYAAHWAPVIRPAAIRLLDDLASLLPAGSPHLLDIGTGTGALAIEALERWPTTRVTGIDASSEMVRWALGEADRRLPASATQRLSTAVAFADRLPFPDASFDLAMSSFVLQLVPNRAAPLPDARRVLRPGAPFGYVTWLRADDGIDPPDRVLEEGLDEFGFDPPH